VDVKCQICVCAYGLHLGLSRQIRSVCTLHKVEMASREVIVVFSGEILWGTDFFRLLFQQLIASVMTNNVKRNVNDLEFKSSSF
jgi:hypothetical protein